MANVSYSKRVFLDYLQNNYPKYTWKQKNTGSTQEVETCIGGHKVVLVSSRDGYYLMVTDGEHDLLGHRITDKDFQLVEDIFKRIWQYCYNECEDKYWHNVCVKFGAM